VRKKSLNKAQGQHPRQDETHARRQPRAHRGGPQPDAARLGSATSSTPIAPSSEGSTHSPAGGCAPFCEDKRSGRRAWDGVEPIINAGQLPSSRKPGCSRFTRPGCRRGSLDDRNSRLESRMRENRTYGSEGGEAKAFPIPIAKPACGPL
jgi:hypothetical protein